MKIYNIKIKAILGHFTMMYFYLKYLGGHGNILSKWNDYEDTARNSNRNNPRKGIFI